jgi:Tol biopolymer transport system component
MSLTPGTTLGPYKILAPLGAGGMGEVYRAHDTRLGRDVAIKVLPSHLAATPEVRARFEREARTISQLNHPHICTLFDVGREGETDYLVMELLEGETLAHRLEKGPLPVAELLALGTQIADALDRAHRAGVVHRDLKPGNVMLTKGGAKLMDFGLARAAGLAAAPGTLTESPTVSRPLTAEGTIVGTFQYMAPEQLEGKEADARSDLWALGCVLYEMATRKPAFEGRSQASLIAAIIEREPMPPSQVVPLLPPALDRVVQQCLTKDPDERIQTAHDVKLQLQWIASGGSQAGVPAPLAARRRSRERLAWVLAGAAGVVAIALGGRGLLQRGAAPVVVRFSVAPEAGARNVRWPRLSPDGRLLAYQADDSAGVSRIWIRQVGAFAATPLAGTENAGRPFWSPDNRSLAFVSGNQMKRIAVGGGPAQLVGELKRGADGCWGTGGVILFDGALTDSICQIPADGGEVAPATRIDRAGGESYHAWPTFLPDGKRFLFLAGRLGTEMRMLKLGRLGSLESREIGPIPSRVEYSPSGRLLYAQDGTLMARPFDAASARFTGRPFPVAEGVLASAELAHISVSNTGAIAYGVGGAGDQTVLTWVDRNGRTSVQLGAPDSYRNPALSPDGTRLAYELLDPGNGGTDVWVRDLRRGIATRVTFDPKGEVWPTWSPDGRRLAYAMDESGGYTVLARASDGTGSVDTLYRSEVPAGPTCWSGDGKSLFLSRYESFFQLWVMAPTPGAKATRVQQTRFGDFNAQLSPDGRWLAYLTDETGRIEVFVQAYPGPGGKWRVSGAGGGAPRWRADGRELFYRALDGALMAVPIRTEGAGLDASAPVMLFQRTSPAPFPFRNSYDVSPDGQRFLVNVLASDRNRAGAIKVVIGWAAEMRKK